MKKVEGIALVSALAFLVVTAIFVGTALLVGLSNRRLSADNVRTFKAQAAAEAGIEQLIYESWYRPQEGVTDPLAAEPKTLKAFRDRLDSLKVGEDSRPIVAGGNPGEFADNPQTFSGTLDDGTAYSVAVRRADVSGSQTVLRLEATGTLGDPDNPVATRYITEDLIVGYPEFGLDYALLTNNSVCVTCHLDVVSLEAAYDENGRLIDTDRLRSASALEGHERVKAASLETFSTDRPGKVNSMIAGTLYTRGETNFADDDASLFMPVFREEDGERTNILDTRDAVRIASSAIAAARQDCGGPGGCPDANGNFYENYVTDDYPDGELPNEFPLPVQDTDGNRRISHTEWDTQIKEEIDPGTLSGGSLSLYRTERSGAEELVAASKTPTSETSLSTGTQGVGGNLVLEGTPSDPIVIQGTVYVDGDVVINGSVTGDGKIVARGNVYVAGDITYACDDDSQDDRWGSSETCNYGKPETLPRFGLVAGKNMMIGQYNMPYAGYKWQSYTGTNDGSYDGSDLNRPDINDETVSQFKRTDFTGIDTIDSEELTRWYIDPGDAAKAPKYGLSYGADNAPADRAGRFRLSFAMRQISFFNQREYCKTPGRDPRGCGDTAVIADYQPRYYKMRDDSPVYRCANERKGGRGSGDTVLPGTGCHNYSVAGEDGDNNSDNDLQVIPDADAISLTPTDNWLSGSSTSELASELAVRNRWAEKVERANRTEPLQIDGVLYSSNGIFGSNSTLSSTQGEMMINGSVVAADTAILMAPETRAAAGTEERGGLRIQYDTRLRSLIDIKRDKVFAQRRANFRILTDGEEPSYDPITQQ